MICIFNVVRNIAADKKHTIPNFDGLGFWRLFKLKFPNVEIDKTSFTPVLLAPKDRMFYEKEYLDKEQGNENKHFAAQLVRIPSVSNKITLHKLLQIAYNVGQLIGCGQLDDDPELRRIFEEYSMECASTYISSDDLDTLFTKLCEHEGSTFA